MKVVLYGALVVGMAMALTACGGIAAPTNAPTNSTTTTTTTNDAPESSESNGLEFLQYSVTLSGAESAQFEGVTQVINLGDVQRLISFSASEMTKQAILQMPVSVEAGDHALTTMGGGYNAQVSTSVEDSGMYTKDVSGTLKLTSADPLQGTFEYSASNEDGQKITASGSFEEVAYSYTTKVTGSVETTFPPGEASIIPFRDEYALTLESEESDLSITFYMPDTVAVGEYGLATTFPAPEEGQIGVIINHNGEDASYGYDGNITGTLTLTTVGDSFTGSFKVTADSSEDRTLTAEGSFENLPVVQGRDITE